MLSVRSLSKSYDGHFALRNVSIDFLKGEIHAVMGENGAGKSTLLNIICGAIAADSGEVVLDSTAYRFRSPREAEAAGIGMVHQELALAPNLSIEENLALGREPLSRFGVNWKRVRSDARAALFELGVDTNTRTLICDAPAAIKQLTMIARAVSQKPDVLILDEPTSSLDKDEVELLFSVLRTLKTRGLIVLFVSHFLDQVFAISDRITVLRDGSLVETFETSNLSRGTLISAMIGRDLETLGSPSEVVSLKQEPFLTAKDAGKRGSVHGIKFSIGEQESIGLAGLLGSGRTESLRIVFGLDSYDTGSICLGSKPLKKQNLTRQGFAYLPEDRKVEGIITGLSVAENILICAQARRGWFRKLPVKQSHEVVQKAITDFRIVCSSKDARIESLSGGNQQKVLLARLRTASPRLILVDEPTRGVDIGAKFEIEEILIEMRSKGTAMIVTGTDLNELLRITQKVAVLRDRTWLGPPQHYSSSKAVADRIIGGS